MDRLKKYLNKLNISTKLNKLTKVSIFIRLLKILNSLFSREITINIAVRMVIKCVFALFVRPRHAIIVSRRKVILYNIIMVRHYFLIY